ncbi:hypothetical protein PkoCFBP13504_20965 [Pseudomonas koreensis]|nr:hypothetical protein PkoCFBP13504_20965 [Pseudomonas koreensis]
MALRFRSWSRLNDRRKTNVGASLLAKALHQPLIALTGWTLSRAGSLPQGLGVDAGSSASTTGHWISLFRRSRLAGSGCPDARSG